MRDRWAAAWVPALAFAQACGGSAGADAGRGDGGGEAAPGRDAAPGDASEPDGGTVARACTTGADNDDPADNVPDVSLCEEGEVCALLSTRTQPNLERVTRVLDDLFTSSSSVARMELSVVTPRRTRTMRMRVWARGEDRALIVVESPSRDRGTATLRRDRNLWNYLPRRRTRSAGHERFWRDRLGRALRLYPCRGIPAASSRCGSSTIARGCHGMMLG